jgi:anti-sigma B factor antagonist
VLAAYRGWRLTSQPTASIEAALREPVDGAEATRCIKGRCIVVEGIQIRTAVREHRCLMVVRGEVDLNTCRNITAIGRLSLTVDAVTSLTIDMSGVEFIDSTGLGALIDLRTYAHGMAKELCLLNPHERVIKIIDITGLAGVFHVETYGRARLRVVD